MGDETPARCPTCADCPDLVSYGWCATCNNRAASEGRARWYVVGKHGNPSGFREPDGSFTPNTETGRDLMAAPVSIDDVLRDKDVARALIEADEVVLKVSRYGSSGTLFVLAPKMEFVPEQIAYIICHPDDEQAALHVFAEVEVSRKLRTVVLTGSWPE